MNRKNLVLICSIAVALAAPGATAAWSSQGGAEPDYAPDVTEGFMFANADQVDDGARRIYFNVVREPLWGGINPNVGATESHLMTPTFEAPAGWLGVWKDCNADGYIGNVESAVVEYSDILIGGGNDICPSGTEHNKNGWVYEFIWVIDGANEREVDHIARYINDSQVLMWGDFGLPPTSAPEEGGSEGGCFVNPPIGFFSSTGAMIDFVDCNDGRFIAETITAIDEGEFCAEETNEATCMPIAPNTGLGFGDQANNPGCSESLLNQKVGVWGPSPECPDHFEGYTGILEQYPEDDPSGNQRRAFQVWDCSATTPINDPTTEDDPATEEDESRLATAPGVGVPSAGNGGSVYEGVNHTSSACDPSMGGLFYANPEADVEQSDAKVGSDYVFEYFGPFQTQSLRKGSFCGLNLPAPVGPVRPPADTPVTGPTGCVLVPGAPLNDDTPQNLGVRFGTTNNGINGPMYFSSIATLSGSPTPTIEIRGGSTDPASPAAPEVDGEGPFFMTYYARVFATDGVTFPGAGGAPNYGTYGIEWCGTNTAGVFDGFDCNRAHWYDDGQGSSTAEKNGAGREISVRPGDEYNLRDIDCVDNSLVTKFAPGVGPSLVLLDTDEDEEFFTTGPCRAAL